MPFETTPPPARRVAVIGGGISGLAAAWLLKDSHEVTLYEAEPRFGGHARTRLAGRTGEQPVDTGFIVFNRANYPNLVRLFEDLDVPIAESTMSFGVSARGGRLEYALHGINALFAQRQNAVNPNFLRMLRDIVRFNARARTTVRRGMTIGDLLAALGTGPWFRDYYILPFSGAIWSTPCAGILDFPAEALVTFFENHALLNYSGQHQWYTVRGGSVEYVRRVEGALRRAGVDLRPGTPVTSISRGPLGVTVTAPGDTPRIFDDAVLATHSDVSLGLLSDPSPEERSALSRVRFQSNHAVLHSDPAVMPRRRSVWASWVYSEPAEGAGGRIGLSYWMNSLQPIPKDDPLFVTLNGAREIDPRRVHDEVAFQHPVFDLGALAAQREIRGFNGARGTWFCGAWMRNGFHEDGFASARDAVTAMAARDTAALAVE